ncbi:MAG: tetratricopeptide repeat protein [Deltaproteobacteria bacterium]|nr:tetratricopeptide repeat protein [Deltaproteobacteria bacterium]
MIQTKMRAKLKPQNVLAPAGLLVILSLVALLYSQSLSNPLSFDSEKILDLKFGQDFFKNLSFLNLRWVSYLSFSLINKLTVSSLSCQHAFNIIIHAANILLIFVLLKSFLTHVIHNPHKAECIAIKHEGFHVWRYAPDTTRADTMQKLIPKRVEKTFQGSKETRNNPMPVLYALAGCLFFGINPAAVYGVAYLVQRSILLATFFSLLTLMAYLKGLSGSRKIYLCLSVVFYFLAIHSKEHAIMIPCVLLVLTALFYKIDSAFLKKSGWVYVFYAAVAIDIILRTKGIIGTTYEPHIRFVFETGTTESAGVLSGVDQNHLYPLSIINQGALFFRYLFLFFVPYTRGMSIDIHLSFPKHFIAWPETCGFLLFVLVPVFCVFVARKNTAWKMLALSLLYPWTLFLTELAVVRITEPFVLYRAYIWMSGVVFLFAALALTRHAKKILCLLFLYTVPLFFFAHERLSTFTTLSRLWQDAVIKLPSDDVPGSYRPYNSLGYALLLEGRPEEALIPIKKSITIAPDYPMAHYNLAWGLEKMGDLKGSILHYKEAITYQPNYLDARVNLGALLIQTQEYQEAFTHLAIAEQINPESQMVLNNLGGLYYKLNQWEKAMAYFKKVLSIDPNHAIAYNNTGLALTNLDKKTEALDYYLKAVALDPGFIDAYANLGKYYFDSGDLDTATTHYKKTIELNPKYVHGYFMLGYIAFTRGKTSEALALFERVTTLKPDHHDAYYNMGLILMGLKKDKEALFYLDRALTLDPEDQDAKEAIIELKTRAQ